MMKAQNQAPSQGGQTNNVQSGGQSGSGPGINTSLQQPVSAATPQTPPEMQENHTPPSVGPPPLLSLGPGSLSTSRASPSPGSPPISSWNMGPAKAEPMNNSYIPQYAWYHHGHDPSMNSQLLT